MTRRQLEQGRRQDTQKTAGPECILVSFAPNSCLLFPFLPCPTSSFRFHYCHYPQHFNRQEAKLANEEKEV